MRYAVIPEEPDEADLEPVADILCEIIGLPQSDAHPSSVERAGHQLVAIYKAVFRAYAVPTPSENNET